MRYPYIEFYNDINTSLTYNNGGEPWVHQGQGQHDERDSQNAQQRHHEVESQLDVLFPVRKGDARWVVWEPALSKVVTDGPDLEDDAEDLFRVGQVGQVERNLGKDDVFGLGN